MDVKPFSTNVKVELVEFEDDHNNPKEVVTGEESVEMEINYKVKKEDEGGIQVSFPNECFGSDADAESESEYLNEDYVDVDADIDVELLSSKNTMSETKNQNMNQENDTVRFSSVSSLLPKKVLFSGSEYGDKKVRCDQCPETFKTTFGLYAHIRKSHQLLENQPENIFVAVPLTLPAEAATNTVSKYDKNAFKCDQCLITFSTITQLWIHKENIHTRIEKKFPFQCQFCLENDKNRKYFCFETQEKLNNHMKHNCKSGVRENPSFECDVCFVKLNSLTGVKIHKKHFHIEKEKQYPFQCQFCLKNKKHFYFETQEKLDDHHMKQNCKSGYGEKRSFECDICYLKLNTLAGVKKHKNKMHKMVTHEKNDLKLQKNLKQSKSKQTFKFSDSECFQAFDNLDLEHLENREEDDRNFEESFTGEESMEFKYIVKKEDEDDVKVSFSNKCFSSAEYLNEYIEDVDVDMELPLHKNSTTETTNPNINHEMDKIGDKKVKCDQCLATFKTTFGLYAHIRKSHQENKNKNQKNSGIVPLPLAKPMPTPTTMTVSKYKKNGIKCSDLGKKKKYKFPKESTTYKNEAAASILLNENKKDDFLKCDLCPNPQLMIFTSRLKLEEHVIEVHVMDKEFQCTIQNCFKTFIDAESLEKHLRICKQNSKNKNTFLLKFKCYLCRFSSDDEKQLIIHINFEHCLPTVIISK